MSALSGRGCAHPWFARHYRLQTVRRKRNDFPARQDAAGRVSGPLQAVWADVESGVSPDPPGHVGRDARLYNALPRLDTWSLEFGVLPLDPSKTAKNQAFLRNWLKIRVFRTNRRVLTAKPRAFRMKPRESLI